jgi:quinol monooxygenase YgiN
VTVLSLERYPVAVESRGEFEELLAEILATMREQPGLLWADAGRGVDDGFLMISEWRTADDCRSWRGTDAAARWDAATDPLLAGDASRRLFDPAG